MPYDAVMFDLDGTLADTLADIAAAGNHALQTVGRPTFPQDAYRTLAGQGLARLIQDALGPGHQQHFDAALSAFHSYYAVHRYDQTAPYPGVAELLDLLTSGALGGPENSGGVTLAVMSNKPDAATCDMVEQVFGRWSFAAVRGHRPGYPVKPDPRAALEIAAELNIPPQRWIYVGDTDVDMQTGRAAGFLTVGVSWGFRTVAELKAAGAQAIIDQPDELLRWLR